MHDAAVAQAVEYACPIGDAVLEMPHLQRNLELLAQLLRRPIQVQGIANTTLTLASTALFSM